MSITVFFSWQSDTPNRCGRTFIEGALNRAIELLAADAAVESAVRDGLAVDTGTRGVAGTPPIVDTIFAKIDRCAVFVSDLTLVGKRLDQKTPMPNPNVLVEHGWALKSLSHTRMLAVMNTAFGECTAENLPFDLRHLLWPIQYKLEPDAGTEEKKKESERLAKVLKGAIGEIIASAGFKPIEEPARQPFAAQRPRLGAARFREGDGELGVLDPGFLSLPYAGKTVKLASGPAFWLRAMPLFQPEHEWSLSEIRKATTKNGRTLMPLGWNLGGSSWNYVRADDGFGIVGMEGQDPTLTHSVAFAFVTGEVWSTIVPFGYASSRDLPQVESVFAEAFSRFADFLLNDLQIDPPFRWIAGMEQTKGRYLTLSAPRGSMYAQPRVGPCTSDQLVGEGTYSDREEGRLALRSFFELIHDRCGVERPPHMDQALLAALSRP